MGLTTIINDPVTLFFAGLLVGEFIILFSDAYDEYVSRREYIKERKRVYKMKLIRIDRNKSVKHYKTINKITFRTDRKIHCIEPVMSEIVVDFFTGYEGKHGMKKLKNDIYDHECEQPTRYNSYQSSVYVDDYAYELMLNACIETRCTMSELLRLITGGELFCRKSVGRITRDVDEK